MDIALLTEKRFLVQKSDNWYIKNILLEDDLIASEFKSLGLSCCRVAWDGKTNLSNFKYVLFRTTWNYFEQLDQFILFLNHWKNKVNFINPYDQIIWNLDKDYLLQFNKRGINIPNTIIVGKNQKTTLKDICKKNNWRDVVIKPCVSAGGWETHLIKWPEIDAFEKKFKSLIKKQRIMVQVFQKNIQSMGEVSLMIINQKFSHAVIKKAKKGDFRVQDDYGGSVSGYKPEPEMISFANNIMCCLNFRPIYARVDLVWDNNGQLALSELELIEPEMWFRFKPSSSKELATAIKSRCFKN